MSLLFDENLSPKLVTRLADLHPGSAHVRDYGFARSDDAMIWSHAAAVGLDIVTKDGDFAQLGLLHGPPPKVVVWLRVGNRSTPYIEQLIRRRHVEIAAFLAGAGAILVVDP